MTDCELKVRLLAIGALMAPLVACGAEPPLPTPISPIATTPAPIETVAGAPVVVFPPETPAAPPKTLRFITPAPTPTPGPSLRALTGGGCCTQPFWSPDGSQVWFIDKPGETQPGGVWGVSIQGGEPQFITDKLGVFSPDGALIAYPEAGQTIVERPATGERWVIPAGGRAILFSPDSSLVAWQEASSSANFDRRLVEIWVASSDGRNARKVTQVIGGGLAGWFPDGTRLLISGRETFGAEPFLAAVNLSDGALNGIARGTNLRGALVSPGGGWVAYQVVFSGDLSHDGLWIARTDGSRAQKVRAFGAYRWRAEGRLLIVPLELNLGSHRL
ncbi:MAG: hypothetical protein RMK99_13110, partial [Anaerolineales bacterium]|nr:hypothetical protein [Anaerolineales bacterium]